MLNLIFGKKAETLFELIRENPLEVLPLVDRKIEQRQKDLAELKRVMFSPKWRGNMDANFYKALDVKSNSIKFQEKRKLVNKNVLAELRSAEGAQTPADAPVPILETVPQFLGQKKPVEYFHLSAQPSEIANPVVAFRVGEKDLMTDVVQFLICYARGSKGSSPTEF